MYDAASDEDQRAFVRSVEEWVLDRKFRPEVPREDAIEWQDFVNGMRKRRESRVPQALGDAITTLEQVREEAETWKATLTARPPVTDH
jgi:hypothetical protein